MTFEKISVVIPSYNEGDNLVDTVHCLIDNNADVDLEVIVVDDGSTDGSGDHVAQRFSSKKQVYVIKGSNLGVAGARNYGAKRATGDVLVFLDAHCFTPKGWLKTLTKPLAKKNVGMVSPVFANLSRDDGALGAGVTWRDASLEMEWLPKQKSGPYPVPLLPGGCNAIRKEEFIRFGEFEPRMTRWGSEGEEQSLRVWLMGYQVIVEPRAVVHHLFRNKLHYQVDYEGVLFNRLLIALLHMNHARINRVMDFYKPYAAFSTVLLRLLESDVMERRCQWQSLRKHDDNWFFNRFKCQI